MKEDTKFAAACAATGSAATGGTLVGITAGLSGPAANLGGYVTAQIVTSSVAGIGGPIVSTVIATIGGPVVAGALAVVGTGAVIFAGVKGIACLFE